MVFVWLEISAVPGRATEMIRALRSHMVQAQAEEGCVACHLYTEPDNSESICYTEEWETCELLESQIRSGRFARLLFVMESSAESPTLKFFFVSETRGLDYIEEVRSPMSATQPDKKAKNK